MFWNRHSRRKEDVELTEDILLDEMEREKILLSMGEQLGKGAMQRIKDHIHALRGVWIFMDNTKFNNNVLHEEQLYLDGIGGSVLVNSKIKNCYSVRSMNPLQELNFSVQITVSGKGITKYNITGSSGEDLQELEQILSTELSNME